jgi:CarboxypepD_reg-like domain
MTRAATAVAVLTVACGHAMQQPCVCAVTPEQANEVLVASASVAKATIRGVVFDSATGRPLPGASVLWEPTRRGALSGTNGEFTVVSVPIGPGRLHVQLIGYKEWVIDGAMRHDVGLAARVAAQMVMIPMNCDVFGRPLTGIAVTVRDAVEGGAPRGMLRMEIRDGTYFEAGELVTEAEAQAGVLELARGRAGRYTVSVTGAEYHPWTASGIEIKMGTCGWVDGVNLSVWLLPK